MKYSVLSLLLLAGCATPASYSPLPPPNLPLTVEKLTAPQMLGPTFQFSSRTNVIPWQYPTNTLQPINAYCWQLQTSVDLTNWQDVSSPCLTNDITVGATNTQRFFRLVGVDMTPAILQPTKTSYATR